MSWYEGLSLALSTFGTMATVFIGFRQLRQAAPAAAPAYPQHPAHGYGYGPAYGVGSVHAPGGSAVPAQYGPPPAGPPAPMGSAAPPVYAPHAGYGTPPTHGATAGYAPTRPAGRVRPGSVRTASILLFLAAALQPVAMIAYYGLEYLIDADAASADARVSGVTDLTIFGILAVLCGVLGILVARGNRVGLWIVWVFGLLAVPFAGLAVLGLLIQMADPGSRGPVGLLLVVLAYLIVISFALAASAAMLLGAKARAFFFARA
jgi:hypothetical protein